MRQPRLRSRRSSAISILAPLALIGVLVAVGSAGGAAREESVTLVLSSLIIVLGLQLFIGNSGIYSFGQLAFAATGAYLSAILTLPSAIASLQTPAIADSISSLHLGVIAASTCAVLGAGVLALIVGVPLMRASTAAIPISTFAFLLVAYNVLANWDVVSGGSSGLVDIPKSTGVLSAGVCASIAVLVTLAFKWSASGYRLVATRESEIAARSLGVVALRERMIAFVASAMLCGLGGALAVHESGVLNPATFYFAATTTSVTMLVLGGAGSVFGAAIGTLAVAGVNEALRGIEEGGSLLGLVSVGGAPGLSAIGVGTILLLTMILLPNGLSGSREAGELNWIRRLLGRDEEFEAIAHGDAAGAVSRWSDGGSLWARSISVSFGSQQVLRGVDLEVRRGEALGLIGPNGAGKTTLVNVLSGYQRPDSGALGIDELELGTRRPEQLARLGIARTFQAVLPFAGLSGLENVAVGALGVGIRRQEAVRRAAAVLARLGASEIAGEPAGVLPPGKRRLLGIARTLAMGPRFLLLDEPAAGLSEEECAELVDVLGGVLADFRCGILLIEHEMDVVMGLCPRIQVLDDGATLRIGSPAEIMSDPRVIGAYLGSSFTEATIA